MDAEDSRLQTSLAIAEIIARYNLKEPVVLRAAIIMADVNGRILWADEPALEIFGYPSADLRSLIVEDLMDSKHHEAHRAGVEHVKRTGKGRVRDKYVVGTGIRADGRRFTAVVQPIADKRTVLGLVLVTRIFDLGDQGGDNAS